MSARSCKPAGANGFSLLEAIVALVLVAMAGMALFAWISASIDSLVRLEEANAKSEATVNILEYMDRVNPMLAPQGDVQLGSYSLRWRADLLSPITDGPGYPAGLSLYQVALYRIDIAVAGVDGKQWFDLELRQVGYKQVRTPEPP